MRMRIILFFRRLWEEFCFIINDTSGSFVFNVDGHEIIATFTEKRNDDLVPRLREILLGYPHIRQAISSDSKIKKNKFRRRSDGKTSMLSLQSFYR